MYFLTFYTGGKKKKVQGPLALVKSWHVNPDPLASVWGLLVFIPLIASLPSPPPTASPSKLWNKSWEMRGPPAPLLLLIPRCANPRSTRYQTVTLPKS